MTRANDKWKGLALIVLWAASVITCRAQSLTILVNFDEVHGAYPIYGPLVQGTDGNLYGTTYGGGGSDSCYGGCGTIYKTTLQGLLTTLYTFCAKPNCSDGSVPETQLIQADDGNFYGTTTQGGTQGWGTIFRLTPSGAVTTIYSFCAQTDCKDGAYPYASGLIQGLDRGLYGATRYGGGGPCGCGTVFRIDRRGTLTVLHAFQGADGGAPSGRLVQALDGNFYGTTEGGGAHGYGTIFKLTPNGLLTTLHNFDLTEGGDSISGLVQADDGNFYGTTTGGGSGNDGVVFKITPNGVLTTLHSFNYTDGANPQSALDQATDGNLYGTTEVGGNLVCSNPYGCGNVFVITTTGNLTILHDFDGPPDDGAFPAGTIFQNTNGKLYGTTVEGGPIPCGVYGLGCGTLYSLDFGLRPFVTFMHASGKVGGTGGILGQGFTGTTSVSVNGTPASFKVVSDTFLKATVPAGATTGFVTVTTPGGTLTSNKIFRVRPQLLSFDPPSGPVGTQVTITGVSLTQTQGVGFGDRVPARFTVNSDTQVTATVPAGAKTGKVGIETKGGTAISSGTFTVTP